MDIGIQSNVWSGEVHKNEMARMIAEIAETGYAGIEIGAHRFENLDHPEFFLDMVKNEGLHVSGIHTLGKFYFDGNLDYPTRAADYTQSVDSKFMLVSGKAGEGKTRDDYQLMAEVLNQTGEICQGRGLTYCYHNHWWEIQNGQEELRAICNLTDPKLVSLCLDIGWVERAGASVIEVTVEFLDRIQYFHLKDTKDEKFVDLGEGTVDFPGWLEKIRAKGDFYLTHERDEILPNAHESASRSRQYLRTIGL
ncbi:MAG: sugar phosphate isomerase/epimerase [Anaerolineales bacterium]|nr:sugar phosphate isomerase/epimerase [Anaerolineales bacterium]